MYACVVCVSVCVFVCDGCYCSMFDDIQPLMLREQYAVTLSLVWLISKAQMHKTETPVWNLPQVNRVIDNR